MFGIGGTELTVLFGEGVNPYPDGSILQVADGIVNLPRPDIIFGSFSRAVDLQSQSRSRTYQIQRPHSCS